MGVWGGRKEKTLMQFFKRLIILYTFVTSPVIPFLKQTAHSFIFPLHQDGNHCILQCRYQCWALELNEVLPLSIVM